MTLIQRIKEKFLVPALDWSEQYTQTDMSYIFRGSFWTSFGFGTGSLLSLVLVIAFANLLPKETYGTYKYVMSFSGLLGFLTFTGMNTAVSQMVARGHDGILPYAVKIQLRFNILFAASSFIIAGYYALHGNHLLAYSLAILGIFFPFIAAFNTYGAYLAGKQRFRQANLYGIVLNALYVAGMVFALTLTRNVPFLVLAYCLTILIPLLVIYTHVVRSVRSHATPEEKSSLLEYGGHMSALNILANINAYIDNVLVYHYAGAVQLAVYGLADAIPSRLKGFAKSIIGIAFPKLAQKNMPELRYSLWLRAGQTMLLGIAATGIYWVAAPWIFKIFFPKYLESIHFSRLIMLNFIFIPVIGYTAGIFQSQRLIRLIYISSLSANAVRFVLYILFASLYGVLGVIIALVASNAFSATLNLVLISFHADAAGKQ